MHSSLWLKGEYFISPPTIFVWSWYLMVLAFLSYLFSFVSFCTRSLMLIECHPSAWNYFSHLVFSVFVYMNHSSSVTSNQLPLTSMTFQEFIHAGSTLYILLFVGLSVCQSIWNEASSLLICLFSASVFIWTYLSHFFCLLLEVHPTHYLQWHSLPYMSLKKFFYVL